MPINIANDLLNADFSLYTHSTTGKQALRTLSYSIPARITPHVRLVHPTVSYAPSLDITSILRDSPFLKGSLIHTDKDP